MSTTRAAANTPTALPTGRFRGVALTRNPVLTSREQTADGARHAERRADGHHDEFVSSGKHAAAVDGGLSGAGWVLFDGYGAVEDSCGIDGSPPALSPGGLAAGLPQLPFL